MAKDLVPTKPAGLATDLESTLAAMPTQDLRTELRSGLFDTAKHLLRLATIVKVLEERGEDLSDIKAGMFIPFLRRVAYGQLMPEIMIRFNGAPAMVQRISSLPLPDQKRLAAGEPVRLMVRADDGRLDHRMVDPANMTRDQFFQVFAHDRIRTEQEQVLILEQRRERPSRALSPERRVKADRERRGIMVGRSFATQAETLDALAELSGEEDDGERSATIVVKLTEAEHRRLKTAAANAGREASMQDLARRALRAAGLI